ncbi:MAG TPA: AsmA-like C-terminal region-containing protein, partial [Candidatus Methylomirabilis sp.]|nr:AsmA-like C-terminal region-containing protein [Candidatus Methylomirabilis sp.]
LGAGAGSFTIDRKNFDLDLALGGGSQRLRLNIGLPPDRTLRLDLALADADLTQLLKLADIGSLTLSQARGTGRILVRSPADDYADAEGEATLTALRLVLEGEVWESRDPLELAWRGRTVMVRRARFRSADREVEIHGRLEDGGQTDLQVSGQLPFAALSSRLPHMKPTGGMVTADIRVRGSLSTPEYEGILQLAGGSLTLPGIPVPLQNVRGTTELQAGRALIRELRGEIAGGSLQGTGEASWRANDWGFQFVFQEDNGRAEQLLAGVYTDKSGVTGSLSLGGTLSGRGRGEEDFFSNLKGDLKLAMRDGRMGRQALATRILSLINIGQLFDTGGLEIASQGLPYHRLTADVIIEQGAARTENLLFESRAFNMS